MFEVRIPLACVALRRVGILACLALAAACSKTGPAGEEPPFTEEAATIVADTNHPEPCSAEWQQLVESRLVTGDGQGHGPDIGSDEWRSVVEFKLGIRDDPSTPTRDSEDWCAYIDERLTW
jgi:hypothetical protein